MIIKSTYLEEDIKLSHESIDDDDGRLQRMVQEFPVVSFFVQSAIKESEDGFGLSVIQVLPLLHNVNE
jgi:hypothetical protein